MTNSKAKPNSIAAFSRNVQLLTIKKDETEQNLCNNLNIEYSTLCEWLNGKSQPKAEDLEKLAHYFDVTIFELFEISPSIAEFSDRYVRFRALLGLSDEDVDKLFRRYGHSNDAVKTHLAQRFSNNVISNLALEINIRLYIAYSKISSMAIDENLISTEEIKQISHENDHNNRKFVLASPDVDFKASALEAIDRAKKAERYDLIVKFNDIFTTCLQDIENELDDLNL